MAGTGCADGLLGGTTGLKPGAAGGMLAAVEGDEATTGGNGLGLRLLTRSCTSIGPSKATTEYSNALDLVPRAVVRFCTARSAPAGKKTETLRERGVVGGEVGDVTAAAGRVGAGAKPEVDTGAKLVGEAGEVGDPGPRATGTAVRAVGTSPMSSLAAGDVVCADGEATAPRDVGILGGGDGVVDGVGTTPVSVRGSDVLAGCPYAAGVIAAGVGCGNWLPSTGGSTAGGGVLLRDPALLLPAAGAAAGASANWAWV